MSRLYKLQEDLERFLLNPHREVLAPSEWVSALLGKVRELVAEARSETMHESKSELDAWRAVAKTRRVVKIGDVELVLYGGKPDDLPFLEGYLMAVRERGNE